MSAASTISAGVAAAGSVGPSLYVHPIQGMQPSWQGRIDNGVDYETRPGTNLLAVGDGRIVNLNGAFPGGSIVLELDHPFNGHRFVYYGHLAGNKLVRLGQRVAAGDPVARSAQRPTGAENMPGHVEIGFARDASGVTFLGGHAPGPTPWGQAFNTLATRFAGKGAAVNVGTTGGGIGGALSDAAGGVGGALSGLGDFLSDPAGFIASSVAKLLEQEGLKLLLYAGLLGGGFVLAIHGISRATGAGGYVREKAGHAEQAGELAAAVAA